LSINLEKRIIGETGLKISKMGMGGAPLGSLDKVTASKTLEKAYESGINYFDTAPLYGAGNSEKLYGNFFPSIDRDSFVISSKVGRLILPEQEAEKLSSYNEITPAIETNIKASRYKNNVVFNFSREGVLRSIEESLSRLKIDTIDIIFIHDPDDNYEIALNETLPTLLELKKQGVIKAIGAGMNEWEMLLDFAKNGEFDCFLLAGRYTLLDYSALEKLLPVCLDKEISIIIGGPYNSGILATDLDKSSTYFYEPSPTEIIYKAKKIKKICDGFNVPLKAAALQFGLNHPAVASTIPGPRNPKEIEENLEMLSYNINSQLWEKLKEEGLIPKNSP
jgi:D-threo-aldose 1-dehydrogenase|tara:strand:+ start:180 stop:1184 length:1005 start_codon:yes stop_codon:yes gene_type:complete